ncbi:hypothetical protein EH228_10990 [Erwinia endophytica]|uniref:hypothetical protein n=1 Tax=Erwinia endophytica TaxID=1563158 RepID=UPI0012660557|nr:hypothetical protein [Erwinia endophytica]KAB8310347.1 hypothetical protein EH228_10990 [Erwinia endophytica]
MRIIYILSLLLMTNIASASTTLKTFDSASLQAQAVESAKAEGVTNVNIIKDQSFSINKDGSPVGFIISVKGKLKEMQSVCLIGWSLDGKKLIKLLPTVGFGEWQSVTCAGVNAVGVVSKKDDQDLKLGIIYHTMTRFNDSPDYYILGVNSVDKTIFYDSKTTHKLDSSEAKNIAELRRDLQKEK